MGSDDSCQQYRMQGLALMDKFGVTTTPALVLLDGEGALILNIGQEHL